MKSYSLCVSTKISFCFWRDEICLHIQYLKKVLNPKLTILSIVGFITIYSNKNKKHFISRSMQAFLPWNMCISIYKINFVWIYFGDDMILHDFKESNNVPINNPVAAAFIWLLHYQLIEYRKGWNIWIPLGRFLFRYITTKILGWQKTRACYIAIQCSLVLYLTSFRM